MHIRQSILIEASPDIAMEAARAWMRDELREIGSEIIDGTAADGSPLISSALDQDGIRMSTTVSAARQDHGTDVTMTLRTTGLDRGAKLRNLSLLPGKNVVKRQVQASLAEIKASAEQ